MVSANHLLWPGLWSPLRLALWLGYGLGLGGLVLGLHLLGAWHMTPLWYDHNWDNHQERRRQEHQLFAWLERE